MPSRHRLLLAVITAATGALAVAGCGGPADSASPVSATSARAAAPAPAASPSAITVTDSAIGRTAATPGATAKRPAKKAATEAATPMRAGNPSGRAAVPAAGRAVSTAKADHVIGKGTPAGCTSKAVVKAVAAGGVTRFDCGPKPITITLASTAKVVNAHHDVVLDGGGLVTLSGGGKRRILYQNTCDQAQGWTTNHCNDQPHPQLTVQNLTFAKGNATGQTKDGGGGGAIFVRGGRLKVVNSRFVGNSCERSGPDLGGAAVRVLDQSGGKPVYITGSTFGGATGKGGTCSNGGGLSSIGVSWVITNSLFSHNSAVGKGANPQRSGTAGGGSGGAIYADGNTYTITLSGSKIVSNTANEGGGAIFFVSNDRTGSLIIKNSTLTSNRSKGFETKGYPGIFYLGKGSHPTVSSSKLS